MKKIAVFVIICVSISLWVFCVPAPAGEAILKINGRHGIQIPACQKSLRLRRQDFFELLQE